MCVAEIKLNLSETNSGRVSESRLFYSLRNILNPGITSLARIIIFYTNIGT